MPSPQDAATIPFVPSTEATVIALAASTTEAAVIVPPVPSTESGVIVPTVPSPQAVAAIPPASSQATVIAPAASTTEAATIVPPASSAEATVIVPPASSTQATVIIPTLDGGENLKQCLRALGAQTFSDFEIIVVDNSGKRVAAPLVDGTGVRLIENRENLGFGAAVNQGIEAARGEFFCTLNDDAFPDPRWLEELVAAARAGARLGMCASQIRLTEQPERLDSAGMEIYLDGSSKQRGWMTPAAEFAMVEEVLFPSACAALYRRAMLDQVGLFDADFFLYCEDTDLGLRARRAGWGCRYVPGAVVYHRYSGSAGRASAAKAFYVERNRLYLVVKNFPLWAWPLVPVFSAARYAMHLWGLVTGRGLAAEFHQAGEKWWKLAIIVLSANFQALRNLPRLLAKRRAAAKRIKPASMSGRAFWRLLRRHSISARELALQGGRGA